MTALYTSAGTSTPILPIEIMFTMEDHDGTIIGFELEELACRDASCAPPPIGTGGSKPEGSSSGRSTGIPRGPGTPRSTLEALFPNVRTGSDGELLQQGKVQYEDGTLSVEGLTESGDFVQFSEKGEAKVAAQWEKLGVTHDQLTNNLVHTAEIAMGLDPETGKFDKGQILQARQIAAWYTTQGGRLKKLSEEEEVDLDAVVAAATVLSAGRLWDGVANGNYETAARLIDILKKDDPIEIGQQHVDFMEWRLGRATKSTSRIGLDYDHSPGRKVKPSDMDSAQLVETLYAVQAMRGFSSFDAWAAASKNGTKTPREHLNTDTIYPLFTSKGTNQVQQAVSVLRGEVSARQAIAGPKYSSFFSNLRRPDKDYSSTNDTWHYRAMAGNMVLNPLVKTDKVGPGTIRELTIKDYARYDTVVTAQDLFQVGAASKPDNLAGGDGMFRDSTRITRSALDTLKTRHPEQFGDMKIHELQALVWVYYGGGQSSGSARETNWERALNALPMTGEA